MKETMKNAISMVLIITILLCASMPCKAVVRFRAPVARTALLVEVDTGMILYDYNKDSRHPADTLVRAMTLLLAVSACETGAIDPSKKVEMTETAYFDISSTISPAVIQPGEELTVLDLMYFAYIGESAEACNLLAETISGSIEQFVRLMNSRADELSCENTRFINTHGQHNSRQYTTAMDLSLILREAMSKPLFVEISGTYRHDVEETDMSEPRRIINPNAMLNPNSKYYYGSCTSGMISSSYEGGYSSIEYAESEGLSLISVILGSDAIVFEDESVELRNITEAHRLLEWGFSQFSRRTVLSSQDIVDKTQVLHGAGADFVNLSPESSITLLLSNDVLDEDFEKIVKIYSIENGRPLYAPVNAGDVLGEVTLIRDNIEYGTVLLVADTNIELNRLQFIRMQTVDMLSTRVARLIMWALTMIILGYLALVVRYNILRRKRIREIAEAKQKLKEERRRVTWEE